MDPSKRFPIGNLRIIALSATAPNAADLAEWIGGTEFSFDNTYRPVSLGQTYVRDSATDNTEVTRQRQY